MAPQPLLPAWGRTLARLAAIAWVAAWALFAFAVLPATGRVCVN